MSIWNANCKEHPAGRKRTVGYPMHGRSERLTGADAEVSVVENTVSKLGRGGRRIGVRRQATLAATLFV